MAQALSTSSRFSLQCLGTAIPVEKRQVTLNDWQQECSVSCLSDYPQFLALGRYLLLRLVSFICTKDKLFTSFKRA